jgi:hypothetical protein
MGPMTTRLESCPSCGHVFVPVLVGSAAPPPPAPPPVAPPPPPQSPPSYVPPVSPYPAPAPRPPGPSGLSAATVPKILLGLGATCLLVAAVIFLAVAWSWLGVGGRTAVLVALTAVSALSGQWLARRDLGVAAEALTIVALGLVALDLLGARRAGWLRTPTDEILLVALGGTLLVVSLGMCLPARRLFTPQVVAPLGLGQAVLGVGAASAHQQVVAAAAVLCFTALALVGRRLAAVVLPWTAGSGALVALLALTSMAVTEAAEYPTLRGLWVEGHGFGTLAVAGLVLLPWALVRGHDDLRQLVCAVSVSLLTWAAALPALDSGLTALTLAAAASSVFWAVVAAAVPPRWYAVPRVPLAGSLLVLAPAPLILAGQAVGNLFSVAEPFSADASVRLDPATAVAQPILLPLGVAVVLLAGLLTVPRTGWFRWSVGGAAAATALLTAALHPLPLWIFVAVLGPLGIVVAAPSAVLTLLVLAEIVLVAAAFLARRTAAVEPAAGVVLPLALAAFLWTGGHVLDVPFDVRSLVTLVVLGLLAIAVPRFELEVGAAVAVTFSSLAGVDAAADPSVALAVHLTLAGAAGTATALVHRGHRPLAWPGGLLLAAATWVRLYDVGVQAPEAYTLPTAVALVLVGVHRLLRDFDADTRTTLLPGLALATVPSLLWVLVDPVSTRAALLGAGCLVLLLAGAGLRWSAPVVVGGLVGGALVLRELAPYAAQWPQWVLIGSAGAVLLGVGITWEARLRDLRRTAAYLGRLR